MIGIFSNGFGETTVASKIADKISLKGYEVYVFPLVGVPNVSQVVKVPFRPKNKGSGGMSFRSLENFIKDLQDGVLGDVFRFVKTVRKYKDKIKVAFIVGDPFLLFFVRLLIGKKHKFVFNSIYKSELIEKHLWFEKMLIKRCVDYFLPRDRFTNECFEKLNVKTIYFGNPMMDAIDFYNIDYRKDPLLKTLLLLPGSREVAYKIMPKFLMIVESVFEKFGFFNVLCPFSGSISLGTMEEVVMKHSWEMVKSSENLYVIKKGVIEIYCAYNSFGDMLRVSDVVLSCSGTATEQSAGFGKPNIMFFDNDVKWSRKWFERQKILLGDNLKFFDRFSVSSISEEIIFLFNNSKEREKRGEIGKKMVEGIGSIEMISNFLIDLLSK